MKNLRNVAWAGVSSLGGLTLVLALLLSVGAIQARPATAYYYVHEGESIQAAVNLAQAGDEVRIASGVYTENVSITRSIALRGSWDATFTAQDWATPTTLVSVASAEHNVRVEAATPATATVLLEGLTLRGGQDGVHIWAGDVTAEHIVIQNAAGQGVNINGGTVLISATQIMTALRGIEVDTGVVSVISTTIEHSQGEGLLIDPQGTPLSVTFAQSLIDYTGRQGIYGKGGTLQVLSSEVRHVISDGIQLEGGTAAIADSRIHDGLSSGEPGVYITIASAVVTGNHIYNVQDHGLQVRASPQTVITGNEVYSTTGYGIYTRDMPAQIAGNTIYSTGNHGIYARGGAATIVSNILYNIGGDGIRTDSTNTDVVIRDNTLTTVQGDGIEAQGQRITLMGNHVTGVVDNALKADNVGTWVAIAANVAQDSGTGLVVRNAPVFTLTNNLLAGNATGALEIGAMGGSQSGRGFIAHNTMVEGGTGVIMWTPFSVTLVNNIVMSYSVGISVSASALPTASLGIDHTLLWGNAADPLTGTNALAQDPRFIDSVAGDYHLRADSPAVNAGVDAGVTVDWEGDARPQGSAPDAGADEVREGRLYLPLIMREFPAGPAAPPVYRLYADPGQLEWLEGDPYRDEPIPATFVAGRQWAVDLRYRGDTARVMPKKSWKVEFSESDSFSGTEELNLNADYVDQTLLRSAVGYDFLTRAGIPAPHHTYARLYLNDGYYGLFSNVEQIDERFLDRMGWDLHGNLYKGDGNLEPPKWYEDNPLWWAANYGKHTNDLNGYDDMRALINLVNYTPDDQFPEAIAGTFDVNGWLDWYAANILLGNFEMVAKNYYLYHDFSTDKWRILPWDVDLALGHNATFHSVFDYDITWDNPIDSGTLNSKKVDGRWNVLIEHMMRVPEFRYNHGRRLIEMMAGPFQTDAMFAKIDAYFKQIQPYAEADNNRWKPAGFTFHDGPTELKQYVTQRRIWLYEHLPAFMPNMQPPLGFNEISIASGAGSRLGVEIYNSSKVLTWDLGGMYVGDGITRQRIPDGTRIPPRGVWHGEFAFAPTGGTLTLYDRDCFANAVIATVTYPTLTPGMSYACWPDGSGAWQMSATPTPGWLNVGRPPIITGVTYTVPLANMPVTVTAIISDQGNITATLWYRVHPPLEAAPAAYNAIPLRASGQGNAQYVATVPAFTATTWVEFYLEARDSVSLATIDRPGWRATGLGRDYRYIVGWKPPALFINEMLAINDHTIKDLSGNSSDWIELYNAGSTDIDLGGMYLTDDPLVPTRSQLASGTVVPAGGYRIIWASGNVLTDHVGFKLNGLGEAVALFDRLDRGLGMIDVVFYTPQAVDVSLGRYPDGGAQWITMTTPTPGTTNLLLPPVFAQVTRVPRWPGAGQTVTVSAQITAVTPLVSTTLWLDTGSGFQPGALTLSGSFYQAIIPAQADGMLVRYYFEVVDAHGQHVIYPSMAPTDVERYLVGYTPPPLVINEFLALNNTGIRDEAGQYEDWLELFNAGTTPLSLDGLYLSDSFENAGKWPIPSGITLAPGGYLLIWCDEDPQDGPLHASFKLSGDGEQIVLFADDAHANVPIDWITFGPQTPDVSYGRMPDGAATWTTFAMPTPGRSNGR